MMPRTGYAYSVFTQFHDFSPDYLVVFGVILGMSLAAPGVLYALRRKTMTHGSASRKLISSEIFSLFASVYAFFLGFAIITLWGAYGSAKELVSAEAGALMVTYRLATPLPGSEGFRQSLVEYSRAVVEDEWPAMDRDLNMSERASDRLGDVWQAFYAMRPAGPLDQPYYVGLGQALADVNRQRVARSQTLSGNLSPPVWVILAFGLFGVFVGLLLTNPEQTRSQVALEIIVAFLMFSCVYFILDIATPFSGVLNVSPGPFTEVHARMLTLQAAPR